MARIPKTFGEEEDSIMNCNSSDGIYITESVEAQYRLIAQDWDMKEEEKIKNTRVNYLKRDTCTNQCAKSFAKLVANLPNDMMASEYP